MGSISAPTPPIAAPGGLSAPMGEMQPISGVQSSEGASSGSSGGGFLSWITGAGNVQKAEPKVRV